MPFDLTSSWRDETPEGYFTSLLSLAWGKVVERDVGIVVNEYPKGSFTESHLDIEAVEDGSYHWNIIIELWKTRDGGKLICHDSHFRLWRITIFNGRHCYHEVTEVIEGKRVSLIFSFSKLIHRHTAR